MSVLHQNWHSPQKTLFLSLLTKHSHLTGVSRLSCGEDKGLATYFAI